MTRKMCDIFPPNLKSEIKHSLVNQNKSARFSSRPSDKNFVKWGALVLVTLIATLALGYLFLLRAVIDIWPETEAVEYSGTIEVRTDHYHYDINEKIIPGEFFEFEIEESRRFFAGGRITDELHAEGILRVYNNHSTNSQRLVAQTRFVSADGKLFRSTEAVLIPGKSGSIPGHADVRVRAVEAGEAYNTEKGSKFSIPGLQGTPMYANIYAENLEPITGGLIGESPMITAEDVKAAREILLSSITEKAKAKMISSAPEFIFDKETIKIVVVAEYPKPEAGGRYEYFDYFLKIKARSLAFKKTDIEGFLKDILLSGLNEEGVNSMFSGRTILDESLSFKYTADTRRIDDGVITIEVEANAVAYSVIREDLIKNKVAGMNIREAGMALIDHERIADARIIPQPSWLENIPSSDRIKINVRFNGR